MTPAQKKVLDAIKRLIEEKGYSPSFAEIGRECGLRSLGTIYKHVDQLAKQGKIVRMQTTSNRNIVIPDRQSNPQSVRQTHSFVLFGVEKGIYDYIRDGLQKAGYAHAFVRQGDSIVIDMNGIALKSL